MQTGSGLARNIEASICPGPLPNLVGPTLSGILFVLHPRLPFWAAAALCLLLVPFLRASVSDKQPGRKRSKNLFPRRVRKARPMTFLYAIWIANFASFFILGNARYQFPKLARELAMSPMPSACS